MKKTNDYNVVKKGVFALAVVAIVGSTSAVFAQINSQNFNNSDDSGYGNDGEKAIAALDEFNVSFDTQSSTFRASVEDLASAARQELIAAGAEEQVDEFMMKFDMATGKYDEAVNDADARFRAAVADAANKAETKDQFIDSFNRAKAEYFNELDQAKNDFAAVVSNLGDGANQAKDRFIGGYNSVRDTYGNQLEQAKNVLADKLSNL